MHIKPRAIATVLCMIFFIVFAVCGVVRSTDKETSEIRQSYPVLAEAEPVIMADLLMESPDLEPEVKKEPDYPLTQEEIDLVMWNSRIDRCYVMPEIVELVKEELLERTNYDCVFFMAGGYSKYGEPLFQECCHYFSSYD